MIPALDYSRPAVAFRFYQFPRRTLEQEVGAALGLAPKTASLLVLIASAIRVFGRVPRVEVLAARLGCNMNGAYSRLRHLEELGLVARIPGALNGTRCWYFLTAKGARTVHGTRAHEHV